MTISDIITLTSLFIAIVALINEKNRKHLLLKIDALDILIYSASFIMINYFAFYDHFFNRGIYCDFLYFDNCGLNDPKLYSYIISLLFLISVLYKVLFAFYPYNRKEKVIKFYRDLIENNDSQILLDLIERYHLMDIKRYIQKSKIKKEDNFERTIFKNEKNSAETTLEAIRLNLCRNFCKNCDSNKFFYASNILFKIINDPGFISLTANLRPHFFANIYSEFTKEKLRFFPSDLLNQFLSELIKGKNLWLIKELKEFENHDYELKPNVLNENKILGSLLINLSVAEINKVWQPFGKGAIMEIQNERFLGNQSKLYQQYHSDELLWEYQTFLTIKFFNNLIQQAIVIKYSDHFFLNYYHFITQEILINLTNTLPKILKY